MKNILTLMAFAVCGFLLSGCAKVLKSNNIQSASLGAKLEATPVVADLRVEKERVKGQAGGKIKMGVTTEETVTSQALAKALKQDPPSADGPDLLVGQNTFYERKYRGRKLKHVTVTVTGYPAYYTNFRNAEENDSAWLDIVWAGFESGSGYGGGYGLGGRGGGMPGHGAQKAKLNTVKAKKPGKFDWYFTPKYQFTAGSLSSSWAGVGLEGGLIWGKGRFVGLDFAGGTDVAGSEMIGGGWSIGNVYDLGDDMQFVYGVTFGYWYVLEGYWNEDEEGYKKSVSNVAPFVKGRWNNVELTCRLLMLGSYSEEKNMDSNVWPYTTTTNKEGFGFLNNVQLMLGYHFATSKRVRAK
jgi:outer membrane murein-binding lipoprotein Lpp